MQFVQFQFNSGTFKNVQIPFIRSYACRLVEQTFGTKVAISENLQFHI